jgi:3-hydroxyisobutyrate dehydrogenase
MTDSAPRVGFIGLGAMGSAMSARLVAAGTTVLGYDPSASASSAATQRGVRVVASEAAAASGCATVILMLPDSDVVEAVVRAPGFLESLAEGSTIVDMSSSEPARTRALAATVAGHGASLVDAPVSGGVVGAESGRLTVMVGGDDASVERVAPLLGQFGRVVRVGAVGSGHAVKALNNLLSAMHLLATAEAMTVGSSFGVDAKVLLEVFNGSSGRSGSTENKWPNFVLPGTFDSGFALRLMLKDMRIAVSLAERLDSPMALGRDATRLWAEAAEVLGPRADHTEVARWVSERRELGATTDRDGPNPGLEGEPA